MDIGDPRRVIIVEPESLPDRDPTPDKPPAIPQPVHEPDLVPAG